MVDSLLAQFLTVPRNVLKKATLSATQSVIFSVCHKLIFQHFLVTPFFGLLEAKVVTPLWLVLSTCIVMVIGYLLHLGYDCRGGCCGENDEGKVSFLHP